MVRAPTRCDLKVRAHFAVHPSGTRAGAYRCAYALLPERGPPVTSTTFATSPGLSASLASSCSLCGWLADVLIVFGKRAKTALGFLRGEPGVSPAIGEEGDASLRGGEVSHDNMMSPWWLQGDVAIRRVFRWWLYQRRISEGLRTHRL